MTQSACLILAGGDWRLAARRVPSRLQPGDGDSVPPAERSVTEGGVGTACPTTATLRCSEERQDWNGTVWWKNQGFEENIRLVVDCRGCLSEGIGVDYYRGEYLWHTYSNIYRSPVLRVKKSLFCSSAWHLHWHFWRCSVP